LPPYTGGTRGVPKPKTQHRHTDLLLPAAKERRCAEESIYGQVEARVLFFPAMSAWNRRLAAAIMVLQMEPVRRVRRGDRRRIVGRNMGRVSEGSANVFDIVIGIP